MITKDSILSLNFIERADDTPIPAVVLAPGSYGKFVGVDIKGKLINPTFGIISRDATLIMEECNVNNHVSGGVLIYNTKETQCRITRSKFIHNMPFHIEVLGCSSVRNNEDGTKTYENQEKKVVLLEENTILGKDNQGIGIKIGVSSRPKLFLNLIKKVKEGIRIISADPFIYRNSITDCNYGIVSTSYKELICEPKIKINEIRNHAENGILVKGKNNFSVIMNNTAIKDNKKAGIKVDDGAFPRIVNNKISNNHNQGILVVEKSNAYIENNYIYQNYKANVAFGGGQSENTTVLRNKIFNSASEGIFIILAGRCSILMNEIYGNYDGIVAIESVPEIAFNSVYRNRNNGIILLRGTEPDFRNNQIYENEGVGLILREKSYGNMKRNVIKDNEMDLVVEYDTPQMEKDGFFANNVLGEDVRLPKHTRCALI